MSEKFKGLLFDLDGTLIDTSELIIESFKYTFAAVCQRNVSERDIIAFFGKPLWDAMAYLAPGREEELITVYRQHNIEKHDNLAKPFAGVAEAVAKLAGCGVKMAVVTSKTQTTALRGLRLFGLDRFFPVVIGVEASSHHKPHPEPVMKAVEALGLQPEKCLMIGDSPFDLQSGCAAGTATAAVKWSLVPWHEVMAAKPDYVLDSLAQLLPLCGQDTWIYR